MMGRVTDSSLDLHAEPDAGSDVLVTHRLDTLLLVTDIVISADVEAPNRIWYDINGQGYAYSGSVQPVRMDFNPPVTSTLPERGQLAEVTVPFSDIRKEPHPNAERAYRAYFASTAWVLALVFDDDARPWYRIYDDKWRVYYYAQAEHLRLVPPGELAPISPDVPNLLKRVEVQLDEQMVTAYEDNRPVFMARVASGFRYNSGYYTTPVGHFISNHKRPFRHMAAGNLATTGYDLPGVPWVTYLTDYGISFHGTYWHNDYGRPRSHGCINMSPQAARWLYLWTNPAVPPERQVVLKDYGTAVDIYL
jgi:lipoprotein-anchoring transpeptidase ErfK/SrfK